MTARRSINPYQIFRSGTGPRQTRLIENLSAPEKRASSPVIGCGKWSRSTRRTIRACAVEGSIFPGQSRALGRIEAARALDGWRPRAENSWYEAIEKGEPLDEDAPVILRPALSAEAPAAWYVEDGSGRAIALLKNRAAFDRSGEFFAIGYLGVEPDQGSSFMREPPFQELLGKFRSGQR